MTENASLAYHQPSAPIRTPRMAEYEVIARITQRLAATSRQKDTNFANFIDALHENEVLWSTLAADVMSPANQLPKELRGQIFYLYRFTADHSRHIRNNAADAQVLIDINTSILRGLRSSGEKS